SAATAIRKRICRSRFRQRCPPGIDPPGWRAPGGLSKGPGGFVMAMILGIESTCDETAAAVVQDGVRVRSSVIATQFELHEKYRGVVPEIASRAHIENILPVLREAIAQAEVTWDDIDAI